MFIGVGLFALAGCPAGDDTSDPDGGSGAGLSVTWSVSPDVPGPISADLELTELDLRFSSLRAIGDSAPPGDPRTTRGATALRWVDGSAPADVEFVSAPPGVYARLELGVGGDDEKVEIKGRVRVGGTWYPFELEDERQHALPLVSVVTLLPGEHITIPVACDAGALLAAIPFERGIIVAGQLLLDDDDLDAMWTALDTAVSAGGAISR